MKHLKKTLTMKYIGKTYFILYLKKANKRSINQM